VGGGEGSILDAGLTESRHNRECGFVVLGCPLVGSNNIAVALESGWHLRETLQRAGCRYGCRGDARLQHTGGADLRFGGSGARGALVNDEIVAIGEKRHGGGAKYSRTDQCGSGRTECGVKAAVGIKTCDRGSTRRRAARSRMRAAARLKTGNHDLAIRLQQQDIWSIGHPDDLRSRYTVRAEGGVELPIGGYLREAELIDAGRVFDSPGNKELSVRFQRKAEWPNVKVLNAGRKVPLVPNMGSSAPVDV
jgi:hypothetical protein